MKLIGLTGGIGMGKSTSRRFLEDRDLPVIDTDDLARELVEPGQPALEEIKRFFGHAIVAENGQLKRDELAGKVFSDKTALRELEKILHPRIRELWRAKADRWREHGHPVGFVIIPLLFETGAEAEFDSIICVACSAATQRERLQARGWSEEQIHQRVTAQWPAEKKVAQSDFVIWTDTTLEIHDAQLNRIIAQHAFSSAKVLRT